MNTTAIIKYDQSSHYRPPIMSYVQITEVDRNLFSNLRHLCCHNLSHLKGKLLTGAPNSPSIRPDDSSPAARSLDAPTGYYGYSR